MKSIFVKLNPIRILKLFFLIVFFIWQTGNRVNGQVIKAFTQRASAASPAKLIYNIQGDYTMIGNTNLTLDVYGDNTNNSNNNMHYVDVDSDPNTLNSSSATLNFSTENGAVPSCSNIIYAGLYWTGRSSNSATSPETFSVIKGSVTKQFNKRTVLLKGPSQSNYIQLVANTNNIYYPISGEEFLYSAYIEVTDYVKANGLGEYTVADVALIEGNGGAIGYYGGWGMIVVYQNSKMKWRDITIFDGHAYIEGNATLKYELPVFGFHTVQSGPVNLKLGLMAGEGDVGISGDYFKIRNYSDNAWITLNHSGNSSANFFNSSVNTGGNARNPNFQNNTGLDIAMFNIPNAGNTVITNNQTSSKFQYGSTQDSYIIFFIAMAVDAYVPDVELMVATLTINGVSVGNNPLIVQPGQNIEYKYQIKNLGAEAINNTKFIIPKPSFTSYIGGSGVSTINFMPVPIPNNFYYDPLLGTEGSIVWDFGTLPMPTTGHSDTVLARLTFRLKVTDDCNVYKNLGYDPAVTLSNGSINGTGAISGTTFNNMPFIQGYQAAGNCIGEPITDPLKIIIDATPCAPLPVTLLCFSGEKIKDGILLDWSTASESNCDFFTVERSADGKIFSEMRNIPGSGNSSTIRKYSLFDSEATAGFNYYRLTQTDFNGTIRRVGNIISVDYCKHKIPLHIYPNPNNGNSFFVHVNNVNEGKIIVEINDNAGKMLYFKVAMADGGEQTIEVNDLNGQLTPGAYVVTASCEGGFCSQKILVK